MTETLALLCLISLCPSFLTKRSNPRCIHFLDSCLVHSSFSCDDPEKLIQYPFPVQAFYFLIGLCSGQFSGELLGDAANIPVMGKVFRAESIVVVLFAIIMWFCTFSSGRSYYLPDGIGGTCQVRKWDPDHQLLALCCLLSPVQALILLLPGMHRDMDDNQRPSLLLLAVAVVHGYASLLLAHMFLRREGATRAINNRCQTNLFWEQYRCCAILSFRVCVLDIGSLVFSNMCRAFFPHSCTQPFMHCCMVSELRLFFSTAPHTHTVVSLVWPDPCVRISQPVFARGRL